MAEARENMRAWREFRGISQTELARSLGVAKSEISRLEGGQRRLTIEWMERIAEAMQIKRDQLFEPPPRFRSMEERIHAANKRTTESEYGVMPATGSIGVELVEGDEMADTFSAGDAVIIDKTKLVPSPSGIFVVLQAGAKVVRRLQLLGESTVRVSCDNRVYGPVDIDLASVQIVGRVVGRITRI